MTFDSRNNSINNRIQYQSSGSGYTDGSFAKQPNAPSALGKLIRHIGAPILHIENYTFPLTAARPVSKPPLTVVSFLLTIGTGKVVFIYIVEVKKLQS